MKSPQLILDIIPDHVPTLDNFVPGGNGELLHQVRTLAAGQGGERFLYLWGTPGSGRSHLLQALVREAAALGGNAHYLDGARHRDLTAEWSGNETVAVDDVDMLDGAGQIALFNLYNCIREGTGVLLAAGAVAPARLDLRQDLVTRLGWGLVYQVHELTDQEKIDALQTHAQSKGMPVSREVIEYLLRHFRRDLPFLVAMLDELDRYALAAGRPMTVPLVRELTS